MKTFDWLLLLGALALGLAVALVDLSPGWDDTGVSAAAVFAAAAGFGATRPSRAWPGRRPAGCSPGPTAPPEPPPAHAVGPQA